MDGFLAFLRSSTIDLDEIIANINQLDAAGDSVLQLAAMTNKKHWMKLFLDNGADHGVVTRDRRETPLITACERGHISCVELLIQYGADINATNKNRWNPLVIASYDGSVSCLELLLRSGAEVNYEDQYGSTSLYWACYRGHTACAELLIRYGADVNKANQYL